MNKVFSIESLFAGYDNKPVLKDINFTVTENDFIGIVGPNGGGKTTLLKIILGLIKPIKGKLTFFENNREVHTITKGYLPQVNHIDKKFPISVKDVILSGLVSERKLFRNNKKNDKQKVEQYAEMLKITALLDKNIGKLSGGQLQKVFLARAIVSTPRLLILDEPDTYVDNTFEKELYEVLKKLNESMTILIVSHDIGMVSSYIKSIACVNHTLDYHPENMITPSIMNNYNCPIDLITHGHVPHRVLHIHEKKKD